MAPGLVRVGCVHFHGKHRVTILSRGRLPLLVVDRLLAGGLVDGLQEGPVSSLALRRFHVQARQQSGGFRCSNTALKINFATTNRKVVFLFIYIIILRETPNKLVQRAQGIQL
jgi:hypothetical protein